MSWQPYNIKMELVEGCNRACTFCGIHAIGNPKTKKFVEISLVASIIKSLRYWLGEEKKIRIEFAGHGEPTLHPKLYQIIRMFREGLPKAQLQLTTNGYALLKHGPNAGDKLFQMGLNILMVDMYTKQEELLEVCKGVSANLEEYYEKGSINPYYYNGYEFATVLIVDDLSTSNKKKIQRVILNSAGNGNFTLLKKFGVYPLRHPLQKKCFRPFRDLTIAYNGDILICCLDYRHEFVAGKFKGDRNGLKEIWEGKAFNAVRWLLQTKQRVFRPCYKCDYNGGFRLGLLPKVDNPFGSSQKGLLSYLQYHFKSTSRHQHPNAENEPFLYEQKGIKEYL
ncbi:hypothetical protein LCGC14_0702380 [marine sediment metagenome]|uniref:Radical SAM core domain-containing protein n=1 Tax=marine sediment metagenome TaxID=412755 RepID=A0A0F9QHF0_9ZZZZ